VDERRLHEEVARDERRRHETVQPGGVAGHAARHLPPRKEADPGAHGGERRIGVERRELQLDAARVGHVVRVHPDHHVGVAPGEPAAERAGDALAGAADDDDAPVPLREPREHVGGPVRRPVVDGDEREVAEGLPEDGDRRGADGARGVARREQHRGAGHYPS
jgi:hypothetical protein